MKKLRGRQYGRLLALVLTVSYSGIMLAGCGQTAEEETASSVVPVDVQKPEQGNLVLTNEFIGTVSPEEAVYVMPMVAAEVLSTNVEVGDTVAAGDVLCKLDSEAAELQLASAQAQYASAQAGYNSAQTGYKSAAAQYESAAAQADAQVGGAKKLQDYQTDVNIDKIQDGLDDLEENLDEVRDERDKAKKSYEKAEDRVEEAKSALLASKQRRAEAQAKVDALEKQENTGTGGDVSGNGTGSGDAADSEELTKAKEELAAAKAAEGEAEAAMANVQVDYATKKATYEAVKDSKEQLEDTIDDTKESLNQAETVKKITNEDVYSDTQNIVDKSKAAAATGMDAAQNQIASAEVGISAAQVGVDSAKYQLDMYTLTAPISGVIEAVNVEAHGFATSGSPAFIISNKNTMTITFYVSEGIRNTLQPGQKVQTERSGKTYEAVITEIGTMLDQTTGLFQIKASVADADGSLLTGSTVKITADTYAQNDTILIPYDAVYYDESQAYVYVAENGKAVRKNIETGIFDETTMSVLSGLTTQDELIVSWSANLRDGAEISTGTAEEASTEAAGNVSETAAEITTETAAEQAVDAE